MGSIIPAMPAISNTCVMRRSSFYTPVSPLMTRFLPLSQRKLIPATCFQDLQRIYTCCPLGWTPQNVSQAARTNQSHSFPCHFGGRACQLLCSREHLELHGMILTTPMVRPHTPICLRGTLVWLTTQIDLVQFNTSFTACPWTSGH